MLRVFFFSKQYNLWPLSYHEDRDPVAPLHVYNVAPHVLQLERQPLQTPRCGLDVIVRIPVPLKNGHLSVSADDGDDGDAGPDSARSHRSAIANISAVEAQTVFGSQIDVIRRPARLDARSGSEKLDQIVALFAIALGRIINVF